MEKKIINRENENYDIVKKTDHIFKHFKKVKKESGSITLYVLIMMMSLLIIIIGIYINSSNKIQRQEQEIEKIQKEYEKEDINDIYEKAYNN